MNKQMRNDKPCWLTLPLVEFEYTNSVDGLLKIRYVRVTEMYNDYIIGYEIPSPDSVIEKSQYKRFKLAKIARNSIVLRSYWRG